MVIITQKIKSDSSGTMYQTHLKVHVIQNNLVGHLIAVDGKIHLEYNHRYATYNRILLIKT